MKKFFFISDLLLCSFSISTAGKKTIAPYNHKVKIIYKAVVIYFSTFANCCKKTYTVTCPPGRNLLISKFCYYAKY